MFCRTWYPVEPKKLYNPVTSLLAPAQDKPGRADKLLLMKTNAELRRENGVALQSKKDSEYQVSLVALRLFHLLNRMLTALRAQPIERVERKFAPLHIPKKLEAALPFASKSKLMKASNKASYLKKRCVKQWIEIDVLM